MGNTTIDLTYQPDSADGTEVQPDEGTSHLGTLQHEGKTYYYFKSANDRVYMFESAEDRDTFIQHMCLRLGVPVSEAGNMSSFDIKDFLPRGDDLIKLNGDVGVGRGIIVIVTPARVDKIEAEANGEFFGDDIPTYPPEVKPFLDNRDNLVFTGDPVNDGRLLAGIQGAGRSIYQHNYGGMNAADNPLVDLGNLNDGIEELAMKVFGINRDQITVGHLNTLRMMGLIQGGPVNTSGAGNLTLTSAGSQLATIWGANVAATSFIPSASNFIDPAKLAIYQAMFNEDGTIKNKPDSDPPVQYSFAEIAAAIRAFATVGATALPAGVTVDTATLELGRRVFGDASLTTLTVEQVNALIAAGLVTYDPTTNAVTVTAKAATLPA